MSDSRTQAEIPVVLTLWGCVQGGLKDPHGHSALGVFQGHIGKHKSVYLMETRCISTFTQMHIVALLKVTSCSGSQILCNLNKHSRTPPWLMGVWRNSDKNSQILKKR